ncbi:MAG: hypothetical protein ABI693_06915 [Bryobacteraceae bacterium]
MTKRIGSITTAAIAWAIASAPCAAAKPAVSITAAHEARETLGELKGLASKAAGNAYQLEIYIRDARLGRDSQMFPLVSLKEDVNKMGKDMASLEARRDSLDPWEQQAIDKVLPLLREAAANAERATVYFNENGTHLWGPEYRSSLDKAYRDSDQIANTLKNYLKFEKAHEQEEHLEATIGGGAK